VIGVDAAYTTACIAAARSSALLSSHPSRSPGAASAPRAAAAERTSVPAKLAAIEATCRSIRKAPKP
jgi:hypothetical protein